MKYYNKLLSNMIKNAAWALHKKNCTASSRSKKGWPSKPKQKTIEIFSGFLTPHAHGYRDDTQI